MCADVVQLRRGDHSAQRLVLEQQRTAAQVQDADDKWKRKIITGLETLVKYAAKHPKAQAALAELARQVRHPFDPSESDQKKERHVCKTRRRNLQERTLTATTRWMLIMKPAGCSLMRPVLSRKEIT
jgi:hypothetical protein